MNIKTFLLNSQLAYMMQLLEDPTTDRTKFFTLYSYNNLSRLDPMARELASKIIGGSGRRLQMPMNQRLVTMAEYLLDSWFQIIHPNISLPHGTVSIPAHELKTTREMLNKVRPAGAR